MAAPDTTDGSSPAPASQPAPQLRFSPGPGLGEFLAARNCALAFTLPNHNKMLLLGRNDQQRPTLYDVGYERPRALAASKDTLWLAGRAQLWRMSNALHGGVIYRGAEKLYLPRLAYLTGAVGINDLALTSDGRAIASVGKLSCLAEPSPSHNLRPLWKPPFTQRIGSETRCRLAGFALVEDKPTYGAIGAVIDTPMGWRQQARAGGVIWDFATDKTVAEGLSMPSQPRWVDGRLLVLETGAGRVTWVDPANGARETLAELPGYPTAMTIAGDRAIVAFSKVVEDLDAATMALLELHERLVQNATAPKAGLMMIDLKTGEQTPLMNFDSDLAEIGGVVLLEATRFPAGLAAGHADLDRFIALDDRGRQPVGPRLPDPTPPAAKPAAPKMAAPENAPPPAKSSPKKAASTKKKKR